MTLHYGTFDGANETVNHPTPQQQHEQRQQQPPTCRLESDASWWSRLVFGNVSYLFDIVKTRPLTLDDVWQLEPHCTSREVLARLGPLYFGSSKCSLRTAIWRMEWTGFVLSGLLLLMSIPFVLGPAVLLYVMLTSLVWQYSSAVQVFLYLGAFHLFSNTASLLRLHAQSILVRISRRVTSCCHALVFQTALTTVIGPNSEIASITTIYTSGVGEVGNWIEQFHGPWVSLLELVGHIYILDRILKAQLVVVLTGLFLVIVIVLVGTGIENRFHQRATETMAARWEAINECFRGVQSMKLNAWEDKFETKIQQARAIEQKSMLSILLAQVCRLAISWCAEDLMVAAAFLVFVLKSQSFDPAFAFSIMVLAQRIKLTIVESIYSMLSFRSGIHGLRSIKKYLDHVALLREQGHAIVRINPGKYSTDTVVATRAACFGYNSSSAGYTLINVDLCVHRGELVVVHGKAGEGKTTLITALLGEVICMNGEVFVSGESRISYCSQEPWVQSLMIRENILFGSAYDEAKYFAVLDACCLIEDLCKLPNGDQTVVGPRGINLSGGQKARIALARACYADADLYVLDCPLAAVDAVVQMDVFRKCIVELLRNKTVLLATHNAEFIHSGMVDRVWEVQGKTVNDRPCGERFSSSVSRRVKAYEPSPFGVCHRDPGPSKNMIHTDGQLSDQVSQSLVLGHISSKTKSLLTSMQDRHEHTLSRHDSISILDDSAGSMAILKRYYFTSGPTRYFAAIGLVLILIFESFVIVKNFWLAQWSSLGAMTRQAALRNALIYAAFVLASLSALILAIGCIAKCTSTASNRMFRKILHAILSAPFSFFYAVPTGEVLNRFFIDMYTADYNLMWPMTFLLMGASSLVGAILVLWFLLRWSGVALTLLVLRIVMKTKVVKVLVDIRLLGATSDSGDFTIISEALDGLSVIRAFGSSSVKRFVDDHGLCVDTSHRLYVAGLSLSNYEVISFSRVQGVIMVALAILLATERTASLTSAANLGLAMVYILSLHTHATAFVTGWYHTLFRSVSINRLLAFAAVQPEQQTDIVPRDQPSNWICSGKLVFERVWFRYAERDAEEMSPAYALKNVSFSIAAGAKIGVVGRTGSGKSSLAMALFRVHELVRGRILVDDIDIRSLPLATLRSHMSIIVQSPMFYRCTVREYLDPFDEFSDNELWQVLHKTQLSSFVQTLQTELHENGENWSLGQRQLLCLARSLLRPGKIVILDEPFSSIDGESDKKVLSVLSTALRGSTVLFVTHRLDQVLEFCEQILVLRDGEVEDFGCVEDLVARSDGVFFELLESTLLTE